MRNTLILGLMLLSSLCVKAQVWTEVKGLPDSVDGRNHPITFSLDGYGYLGTGYNHDDTTLVFNDFYKYDPVLDEWEAIEPFPGQARGFGYGDTTMGKAYMGFGLSYELDTNTGKYVGVAHDDLWSFDPETGKWEELAKCPGEPRWHPAFVAIGDKVFMGLGGAKSGNLKDWWEYDIQKDSWSQKPDFPGVKRHHPYYFKIDSLVYVGFGHGRGIFKDFYSYNPRTEGWKRISDLPAQGRVAGEQFSHGGKGYVISGQGEDHKNLDSGEFWMYDAQLDSWQSLPAHPGTGRWAPGTFVIDDKLYFVAGYTDVEMKDMWMYQLPSTSNVGIKPKEVQSSLSAYPNPGSGVFHLQGVSGLTYVSLYNSMGQLVLKKWVDPSRLDLSSLPNGNYELRTVNDEGQSRNFRLVLVR